jgi:hypothetical protein
MLPSPRTGLAPDPKVNIAFNVNVVAASAWEAERRMAINARKREGIFIGFWLIAYQTISLVRERCQLNFPRISIDRAANHKCPD